MLTLTTLVLATSAFAQSAPCPLTEDAREGASCLSETAATDDPLKLGAERILYSQTHNGDHIVSDLSVVDARGTEVAHISHDIWFGERITTLDPYSGAYDYTFVAEADGRKGELSPTRDTIRGDATLEPLAVWLQEEAGVWYLPLDGGGGVVAIDEVACMLGCLAGCVIVTEGSPCWQTCSSFCAWLVLTPW